MRHRKKGRSLGRTTEHRKAMLRNMATSLFLHGRVETTTEKAKELRRYAEPIDRTDEPQQARTHIERFGQAPTA